MTMEARTIMRGLPGLTFAVALAAGCAHRPPPRELTEARVAYTRASTGPAATLTPARLRLAKQALDYAE